ncbi:lysozyme inhibitor LprI family protein [Paraburkholderia sp. A2WS-5]|uniref:lysozyme inhibitor LprI family protein n=1 Tax=unclassified Paraburkholderia TaxID=2615204 RepID=UPI003B764E0F
MTKILTLLAIISVSHTVFSKEICNGNTNSEIENCAHENFQSADNNLNGRYKDLLSKLTGTDKQNFVAAQRSWVAYKENYCQAAYDATSPGEEAGVDKWTCLTSVTEARTKEILYIGSSVGMGDYRRSLAIMADLYEHGDTSKVISRLVNQYSERSDQNWKKYVDLNCKMTASKLSEEHNACVARLNFYRNW